jgi:DNA-binding response OmpR family regulator
MKVLLIEDDKKISSFITKGLKEELMSVDCAFDGEEGLYLLQTYRYDVIIIDWMLPKISGPELITKIRTANITTPLLMLTARGDVDDRVEGLKRGADDYLSKPFSFRELVARIHALHRRSSYNENLTLQTADLTLDPLKREVKRAGKIIDLSTKEYELLELLLRNKGYVVTNTVILEQIWSMQEFVESNVINVTIYHLRNKIDRGFEKKLIQTVRGSGYRIVDA